MFLKVIRFELAGLVSLMTSNPDLAVLYLVRDPRATLHSQSRAFHNYFSSYLETYINNTCRARDRDLLAVDVFSKKFPNRIKVFRYEDLADSPIDVSRKLFQNVGLNFTNTDETHVRQLTEAGMSGILADDFSVIRPNSSTTASEWRKLISWDLVAMVQKYCNNWMANMGYTIVSDLSELRNKSLSIMKVLPLCDSVKLT